MEEIIEHVYYEIKNSGYEKKLIAGIVLTGGGSLLKHLSQLTEFMTGMDTRIGYPNEHLAPGTPDEMASPMYATGIGLVIQGIERYLREKVREKQQKEEFSPAFPEEPVSQHAGVITGQKELKDLEPEQGQEPEPGQEPEEEYLEEETRKKPKTSGFLKRIQDWFEGDEE
jgi:cell division protein FtsA